MARSIKKENKIGSTFAPGDGFVGHERLLTRYYRVKKTAPRSRPPSATRDENRKALRLVSGVDYTKLQLMDREGSFTCHLGKNDTLVLIKNDIKSKGSHSELAPAVHTPKRRLGPKNKRTLNFERKLHGRSKDQTIEIEGDDLALFSSRLACFADG